MNEPIAADLINTFHRTFHSAKEGNLQPTRRSTVCEPSEDSLARTNTSEKANTPTMTGISPMPALSSKERSEEHTSELQSLMRISYAVFCLKKKTKTKKTTLQDRYKKLQ